ncbi:competence protein ComK [Staphylococcus caeli]|uniref:ComK family protein n=1 Tax=Staphylococcus caeli TaxID=2201815 RepID=A0A1D4H8U8_9STAP|nr:competence protein ComK [Staphylococcus caeli]SCS33574.1 comK family protein [Staphylococcus caeli]SCS62141.1 comK family protein [Staphylococcus caeli]
MTKLSKVLYYKNVLGPETLTLCQYTTHQITYPTSINQALVYVLESHQLSFQMQLKQSKSLLKIRKLVPIFINEETIIFPIMHQRSPIKYYINACAINGLTSKSSKTIIYFENSTFITVDAPYILIYKKWQESLTLSHLLNS